MRSKTAGLVVVALAAAGALALQPGSAEAFPSWTHAVAWGFNTTGQLGIGSTQIRTTPAPVAEPGLRFHRVAGGSRHSLAVDSAGHLYAWGANDAGQLGGTGDSLVPRAVAGLDGVTRVAAGDGHSLGLRSDGTVWAWGNNNFGQVGDGSFVNRTAPVQVLSGATEIAAGLNHSLAVKVDGTVWAWGNNAAGNLGDGTTTVRNTPVQVAGLTGVETVAAGSGFSLALRGTDRSVWSWGANSRGQLGDGTFTWRSTPVRVLNIGSARVIAAGMSHALAIEADLSAKAWGGNYSGELGDDTTFDRSTPVRVMNLAGAIDVSAGREWSAAVLEDSTVRTWGSNLEGELGSGEPIPNRTRPRVVPGLNSVIRVGPSSLAMHVLAVRVIAAPPDDPGCEGRNATAMDLPAVSPITIPGCRKPDLTSTEVEVAIAHPRRGDVVIDLIAPDRTVYRLKNADPSDIARNIRQTFSVVVPGAGKGVWRLQVTDVRPGADGTLLGWSLFL